MKQQTPSLRPFAALVTGLTDKYHSDPFFRVHVQVACLQVALLVIIAILLAGAYQYLSSTATQMVISGLGPSYTGDSVSSTLVRTLGQRRLTLFVSIFVVFLFLTSFFSIIVSNIALKPSRNSLKFQKRFISDIAHEIRTPLAIIKTSTEVALFDPELTAPVRKTFNETIAELDRMSETINNLLSFDSLIQPRAMQFQSVDLSEIARTVAQRHQELATSRGIRLVTDVNAHALVEGNATALDQVVTNLLKNAINYTPKDKNGVVTVRVEGAGNGGASLSVEDTGIGIAQKDLYHIFEPFYRADTSRARGVGTGAAGLGLAIVNEIVRLHRGTITLRSAPKHGTTIKVTFPPPRRQSTAAPILAPSGSPHEATLDFS